MTHKRTSCAPAPVFALQAGDLCFSLDTADVICCLREAERQGWVPPLAPAWCQAARFPTRTVVGVEQKCDVCGTCSIFVVEVDGSTLVIDLPTLLLCVRFAEQKGASPPLPDEWWLTVAEHYDLWGRITSPTMQFDVAHDELVCAVCANPISMIAPPACMINLPGRI